MVTIRPLPGNVQHHDFLDRSTPTNYLNGVTGDGVCRKESERTFRRGPGGRLDMVFLFSVQYLRDILRVKRFCLRTDTKYLPSYRPSFNIIES